MCGLCGLWGAKAHWSMRLRQPEGSNTRPSSAQRHHDFAHRRTVLNRIVREFGVTVREWGNGQWILDHDNGASVMVDDFAAVWSAVESLARRKIDPLSMPLVERLEAAAHLGNSDS